MDPYSRFRLPVAIIIMTLAGLSAGAESHWKILYLVNRCKVPVWPGLASNVGYPVVGKGGLFLAPGQKANVVAPWSWQGRVWARTGCNFDPSGSGTCLTGDCAGQLECNGTIGKPPATLAQFTLQPNGQPCFYDVSLVDGFNVPISVSGSGKDCGTAGCAADLNQLCPQELQMVMNSSSSVDAGKVVACKSACLAFDLDQFCCRNEYNAPAKCLPTMYSRVFKKACPAAYSYAYDTPSPLFSCTSANAFTITFCPPRFHRVDKDTAMDLFHSLQLL